MADVKLKGYIRSIKASVLVDRPDVTQLVTLEVHGPWEDLRHVMKKPLSIILEPEQLEIGDVPAGGADVPDGQTAAAGGN